MKIIKISIKNEISVHEYPEGTSSEKNDVLTKLIGEKCRYYDYIKPKRLYSCFGCTYTPTKTAGESISMLIDDEGRLKDLPLNMIASYLYGMDVNGTPIVGNVLLVGEVVFNNIGDVKFCGISENQFKKLYPIIELIAKTVKSHPIN